MADALLILTFSPVQSFISEARRTGDLYAGSHILASLASATLQAIADAGGTCVYPVSDGPGKQADAPNRMVAVVPGDRAAAIARAAEQAFHLRWSQIVAAARGNTLIRGLSGHDDPTWQAIWRRQTAPAYLWQCFWAAAQIGPAGYKGAYEQASQALDATKRSRVFLPAEERGTKDSLSGQREALHRQGERARDYWRQVSSLPRVTGAFLRPEGRERLDAIGAVKRFWLQDHPFPSTSTIAAATFLEQTRRQAPSTLAKYRVQVETVLAGYLYQPHSSGPDWPYDGDLLFEETLTPERLRDSYGCQIEPAALTPALQALKELYEVVHTRPSPYYAIIVLDGDSMGKHISDLLKEDNPQTAHQQFSAKLSEFSGAVPEVAKCYHARVIYNGGDDVLALAPAHSALEFAHKLAQAFHCITGVTASAGIAIAHHLSPLDTAVQTARQAEGKAKDVTDDKAAVCVTLMRRGGEHTSARGQWDTVMPPLKEMVRHLKGNLSSGFPYDVARVAYSIDRPGEMLRAELKRLLQRREEGLAEADADGLARDLNRWAEGLPERVEGLANWLTMARFLAAEGGSEDAVVP